MAIKWIVAENEVKTRLNNYDVTAETTDRSLQTESQTKVNQKAVIFSRKQKIRQKSAKRPSFFSRMEHFMGVKTEWRTVLFRLFIIVQYTIQKLVNKFWITRKVSPAPIISKPLFLKKLENWWPTNPPVQCMKMLPNMCYRQRQTKGKQAQNLVHKRSALLHQPKI